MTHHHVNIKSKFNTAYNDSTKQIIMQDRDSSQQTVQDVRTIIQAYCSRQLIYNYPRVLFKKDNNSRIVQGSLLFSTVLLLTWLQSKINTKQQYFKIVGRSYQHKIQCLSSTCILLIPCCIL